jgi:hypothetical protein
MLRRVLTSSEKAAGLTARVAAPSAMVENQKNKSDGHP